MKRISWTVVALIVTLAGLSPARSYDRGLDQYRVRYSTSAFGLDHQSGLISGYAKYSPQVFGIDNPGFVHKWTRYTPYAFGLESNGLIRKYSGFYGCGPVTLADRSGAKTTAPAKQETDSNVVVTVPATPAPTRPQTVYWTASYKRDPLETVRNHLKNTLPGEYQITRIFRIDKELVSFDVLLPQYDLAIKIWNPKLMDYLKQQEDQRYRRVERYIKRWIEFKIQWEADGDKICHIASNDTDQILSEFKNAITLAQSQG